MSDPPARDVTTLALLNLIRLLAAELVAGEHRHDVERVIAAIDQKINSTPLPRGIDVIDARSGFSRARKLLRPYVARLREQARGGHPRNGVDLLFGQRSVACQHHVDSRHAEAAEELMYLQG